MPMEGGGGGGVKCLSRLNTFGVSGVNSVSAKSNKIEIKWMKTLHPASAWQGLYTLQISEPPTLTDFQYSWSQSTL